VASLRHKHALQKPLYQRVLRVALPSGGILAAIVASLAMAFHSPEPVTTAASVNSSKKVATSSDLESTTSRGDVRPPLAEEAVAEVTGTKYVTADLDVHSGPEADSPVLTEIKSGKKVDVTGKIDGKWAEVVHKGASRWVTAQYLETDKPKPAAKPLGGAPCASGSEMEAGLQPDTTRVHRAVCSQFPEIATFGGLRAGDGEHGEGRAVDIMLGASVGSGDAIAAFSQKNAAALGVSEVIYKQRIWTVQRSGEGWRPMSDRGSPTANHMDHVHVTTYGSSGTS
jgi:hypothetical protein